MDSPPSDRIRDLPEQDRPREKLQNLGANSLSHEELIALFLGFGFRGRSAIAVAHELLRAHGGLAGLMRADLDSLRQIKGIGQAKATNLLAALELGTRLARERAQTIVLDHPKTIYEFLAPELQQLATESLRVVLLNTRYGLIRQHEVSRGTVNESLAHPREILRPAIVAQAYAFVLVHNHPSGDPSPSTADRLLTSKVREAADLLQIEFLDHLVIGRANADRAQAWFSFRDSGLW